VMFDTGVAEAVDHLISTHSKGGVEVDPDAKPLLRYIEDQGIKLIRVM
jgi:hypothetical protein